VVVVVEPDPDLRSHLVRVLGPGVSSVNMTTDLESIMDSSGSGGSGGSGGRGGHVPSACEGASMVVVAGPSVPLAAAVAALSTVGALGSATGRWRVAVVGVTRRCSNRALRDALTAGLSDLVGIDAAPDQLRHAVRRAGLALARRPRPPTQGAAIAGIGGVAGRGPIAVFAPKGGAGASTVVVNLAVGLAARSAIASDREWSHPAVIVDADLQFGDQALMLGIDPVCSLASLTAGQVADPADSPALAVATGRGWADQDGRAFERLLLGHRHSGVALLCAPVDPALADTVPVKLVTAAIGAIGSMVPWVVVDLPSHIGDLTLEVIDRSSHLLVVTGTDPTSVKDARVTADTLTRLGVDPSGWTLICNAIGGTGGLSVAQIEQHVGVAAGASIPWDPAIPESLLRGNPVVLEFPGCAASLALMGVVDLLAGSNRPTALQPTGLTWARQATHVRRRLLTALRAVVAQGRH